VLHEALALPFILLFKWRALRVEAFGVFGFGVDDLAVDVHGVLVLEGREARQHLVDQDAQGPPVDGFSVALVQQDLRRDVLRRAANRERALRDDLREAEIDQLKIPVVSDHDVLRLQVPVADVLRVQVLEDADDLRAVELGLLEAELLGGPVIGEKIAAPQKLCQEIDVPVILEKPEIVHLHV